MDGTGFQQLQHSFRVKTLAPQSRRESESPRGPGHDEPRAPPVTQASQRTWVDPPSHDEDQTSLPFSYPSALMGAGTVTPCAEAYSGQERFRMRIRMMQELQAQAVGALACPSGGRRRECSRSHRTPTLLRHLCPGQGRELGPQSPKAQG